MKVGNPVDKTIPATPVNGPGSAAETTAKAGHHGTTTGAQRAHAPDASAKVELSSTASSLLSTGSTPEFDAEKVARIAQAIDSGTFKINPENIADKLISNAKELLSKVQS
ncbi:MAG: flagellar biosynthesis anti-sigma factor FlgM [Caldimonas sp.]